MSQTIETPDLDSLHSRAKTARARRIAAESWHRATREQERADGNFDYGAVEWSTSLINPRLNQGDF